MSNDTAYTEISTPKKRRLQGLPMRLLRIVAVLGVTCLFMMSTDPKQVPAVLLVVPFGLMFILVYLVALEVLHFVQGDKPQAGLIAYRPRLLSAVIASFPVMLLVLQSIMELNRWDVLIALVIFVLAYVFVSRGALPSRKG